MPRQAAGENGSAIVLAAAEGDIRIGRVQRDADELDGAQIPVQVAPGNLVRAKLTIIQSEYAAIVAFQQSADSVEGHGMTVGVGAWCGLTLPDRCPRGSAVLALHNATARERIGNLSSHKDNVRVPGIDGHGHVVITLLAEHIPDIV